MKNKTDTAIFSLAGIIVLTSFLLAYLPRQGSGESLVGMSSISWYEDHTANEELHVIKGYENRFMPLEKGRLFRHRTKSACWLKLRVSPSLNQETERYIEINNASLERVDAFFPDGSRAAVGKYVDVRAIPVKTRIWNIPIPPTVLPGDDVYLRVKTNTIMSVPVSVITGRELIARSFRSNLLFGTFFGIIIAIFFVNLFSFMVMRNHSFYVYLVYLASLFTYHLTIHGFMHFIPMPARLLEASIWISLAGVGLSMMFFAKRFLCLKERLPHVNTVLDVNVGLFLVQTALGISGHVFLANQVAYVTGFIVPLVIVAATIKLYAAGYREVRFYLIAWFALFSATAIWSTAAYADAQIPANYFFLIGSSTDSLLFTLAIFDLIRKELGEKEVMLEREKYYINLSRTDPLTGLYNRRYLNELIKRLEADREIPSDSALIMIDLDNFKVINDTYGHLAGDLILTKTGSKIKKHIRKTDIACRYGGDEFLVFLPGATEEAAIGIAESIRKDIIEDFSYSEEGEPIRITVSVGVSENRMDDSFDGLFLRADAALYQAKKTGRDRISIL